MKSMQTVVLHLPQIGMFKHQTYPRPSYFIVLLDLLISTRLKITYFWPKIDVGTTKTCTNKISGKKRVTFGPFNSFWPRGLG